MSGSIGGKRIKREEVQPTFNNYIERVLKKFPGFVSASITGSYNAGIRKDHGDLDLVIYIKGGDVKSVKEDFKKYLDGLNDEITPRFEYGKNLGKKSQLYGAIVTCGFPIYGREGDYVQIDNVICTSESSQNFQKRFLDLDAAKQCLITGLMRVALHYINPKNVFEYIGLGELPKLSGNQEYEFVLSSAGLSLRKVTLSTDMKEVDREEIWRSDDWGIVEWILSDFDIKKSYEEILDIVAKKFKNDSRSKRRIVNIISSMVKVGPGEVGTPKGDDKIKSIQIAKNKLNVLEMKSLKEYLVENNIVGEEDPRKQVGSICKEYDYYDRQGLISGIHLKFAHVGKNVWFKDAKSLIKFLEDNWAKFRGWFANDRDAMKTIVTKSYDTCTKPTYKTVPFVLAFGGKTEKIWIRRDYHAKDDVRDIIIASLDGKKYNKWDEATGFGDSDSSGRLFEKKFRNYLNSIVRGKDTDLTPTELKDGINNVLGSILDDIIEELKGVIDDETSAEEATKLLKNYIIPGGKKASQRKIFANGFKFDMNSLMSESGKQIADITLRGKDGQMYYLSLKNGKSQSSGPQVTELGKALKQGDLNDPLLNSFCKDALGFDDVSVLCDWYNDPTSKTLKICTDHNYDTLTNLVKLIIGCGYIYVNSNGNIFEVPSSYDLNGLTFESITKANSRGEDLKTLYINGKFNHENFRIIWRASNSEAYPVRFILEYETCVSLYNHILKPVETV